MLIGVHPPALFERFETGLSQNVWIEELGGLVRWTQQATRRPRSAVLDATCAITLPNRTTIVDPLRLRPRTTQEVVGVAQLQGLLPSHAVQVGSEEVLVLKRTLTGAAID